MKPQRFNGTMKPSLFLHNSYSMYQHSSNGAMGYSVNPDCRIFYRRITEVDKPILGKRTRSDSSGSPVTRRKQEQEAIGTNEDEEEISDFRRVHIVQMELSSSTERAISQRDRLRKRFERSSETSSDPNDGITPTPPQSTISYGRRSERPLTTSTTGQPVVSPFVNPVYSSTPRSARMERPSVFYSYEGVPSPNVGYEDGNYHPHPLPSLRSTGMERPLGEYCLLFGRRHVPKRWI